MQIRLKNQLQIALINVLGYDARQAERKIDPNTRNRFNHNSHYKNYPSVHNWSINKHLGVYFLKGGFDQNGNPVTIYDVGDAQRPGYWGNISLNLHEEEDGLSFIDSFMDKMQMDENTPVTVNIKQIGTWTGPCSLSTHIYSHSYSTILRNNDQLISFLIRIKCNRQMDLFIK